MIKHFPGKAASLGAQTLSAAAAGCLGGMWVTSPGQGSRRNPPRTRPPVAIPLPITGSLLGKPSTRRLQSFQGMEHLPGSISSSAPAGPCHQTAASGTCNDIPAREDQKVAKALFSKPAFPFQWGKVPGRQGCGSRCSGQLRCPALPAAEPGLAHLTGDLGEAELRASARRWPGAASDTGQVDRVLLLPHGQISTQIPRLFTPAGGNLANPSTACNLPL